LRERWLVFTVLAMTTIVRRLFLLSFFAVVALFAPGCQSYDKLVELDEKCNQKWADVEASLQRRYDLVPNLVSTVKASAKFEQDTLDKVTQARASATSIKMTADDLTDPAKMKALNEAQANLKGALSRLLVAQESYPELKASQQFKDLMVQLEGTENRILRSREEYNKAAGAYNTELRQIRGTAVNKATGKPFKAREYFSVTSEDVKAAPKVSF
jgi:LemA protein